MCDNDPEALRLLREEVTGERGQSKGNVDNINVSERSDGTSKDYTLDRLAREDAELYDRNGQSLKSYAEDIGVDRNSIEQWHKAAKVEKGTRVPLSGHPVRALYEISKAPERFWEPLAEALVEREWSVRETREKRPRSEPTREPWQGDRARNST